MVEIWGVDSAQKVTESFYDCVVSNYGKPEYWGRYLSTVPNVSDGLTKEEILFLHDKGTKILPIYNNFKKAVGYSQGKIVARNAIANAKRLKIPKGKIIMANLEPFFEVDEGWLRGWVEVFYDSDYKQGMYCDPVNGDFNKAYCKAILKYNEVERQTVLWSAEPEVGATTKRNMPLFKPATPKCKGNVWGWQYARNVPSCSIDQNEVNQRFYNMMF